MNTRQFASGLGNQSQSILSALCRNGHYQGIVPVKLPSGALIWPDDAIEQLIERAKQTPPIDRAKKAREVKAAKRAAAALQNGEAA